ncbi:leucine--tRNA ligase [Patescibacteria group bacterium]
MKYDPNKIEPKWQQNWAKQELYKAEDFSDKEKFYCLDMFPYPSGDGLHVGHAEGYTATDIYSRYLRAKGLNVLHPFGWDAFGLPAENYALQKNVHPQKITEENIDYFRSQAQRLGFSYDWSREINTTDPKYYKWTQWIFLQIFKKGLAYEDVIPINWCPSCQTGIANEEVISGECERCHAKVVKKDMKQWILRITEYADRLLKDLDLLDWPEKIKEMQRNWIGKSEGYNLEFRIKNSKFTLDVYTTRIDTLFGATFMVLAPEHPWLKEIVTAEQRKKVAAYQEMSKQKSDLEREALEKAKTGVFTGAYAINPANKKEIPIWVSDYVMMNYGSGAIMAVPAHDERDFAFAKKYELPIKQVIMPSYGKSRNDAVTRKTITAIVHRKKDDKYLFVKWPEFDWYAPPIGGIDESETPEQAAEREVLEETGCKVKAKRKLGGLVEMYFYADNKKVWRHRIDQPILLELTSDKACAVSKEEMAKVEPIWLTKKEIKSKLTHEYNGIGCERLWNEEEVYTGVGVQINSGEFDGQNSEEAMAGIAKKVHAKKTVNYKLRDWVFSRQRYWGEPIPIIHCPSCGIVPVPAKDLPVKLPDVKNYEPTGTGESPLATIEDWVNVKCPECGSDAKRETNTMPQWAGSCWYYLRYIDPDNDQEAFAKKKMQYWCPVDMYVGGAEHAVLHLLYARFWHKVLYDQGFVDHPEPFLKLRNQGMILGPDGAKMSKSRGNVINPDDVVKKYGADAFRLYEMFMGPLEDAKPWDTTSIVGLERFLKRIWEVVTQANKDKSKLRDISGQSKTIHKAIKEIGEDIEKFKFNTAISKLMIQFDGKDSQPDWRGKLKKQGKWEADIIDWEALEKFLLIFAPFAPHICEELWEQLGHKTSIFKEAWPKFDPDLVIEDTFELVVQVNGKVRGRLEAAQDISQDEAIKQAKASEKVKKWLEGKEIVKKIYVPGRLVNFVVK